MKAMLVAIYSVLILSLVSCQMPTTYLVQTELYGIPNTILEQDGNHVDLYIIDSLGRKAEDHGGIYKYEYIYKRLKDGYLVKSLKFYDSTMHLIDTSTPMEYAQYKVKFKRDGRMIGYKFLDYKGELITPSYINFSKVRTSYRGEYIRIDKYFDEFGKPRCGELGYRIKSERILEEMIFDDTTHIFENWNVVNKLDCNRKPLGYTKWE